MPTSFDEIRTRAGEWIAPVSEAAPAGASALYDPQYQRVLGEVGKLDSAEGGRVDWAAVLADAGELLRSRTKDARLAAYLAHALHVRSGAAGLATGAALVAELLGRYGDALEPRRRPARAGAVEWLLEKTRDLLEAQRPAWSAGELEEIEVALARLEEAARAHLADAAPAFGHLRAILARTRAELAPVPTPGPPPAHPPALPEASPERPPTTPDAAAPPGPRADAAKLPEVGSLAAAGELTGFLRGVGDALIDAARSIRRTSTSDPASYRILRTGLWLHLESPPATAGGRTAISPPPLRLTDALSKLAQNGRWAALLEEVESALPRQRLALGLQHLAWRALDGLGAEHARARDAVALELRALLARLPSLLGLAFADGTPLAGGPSRGWIDEVVLPRCDGPPGAAHDGGLGEDAAAPLADVRRALASGDAAGALARARAGLRRCGSGRERFVFRLELARACAAAGLGAVAAGMFEALANEASAHGLDAWEPQLSIDALTGLIAARRALVDDPRAALPPAAEQFRRLCGLDPAAAHEVWR